MKDGGIIERPVFGLPQKKVFGHTIAVLSVESSQQASFLRKLFHDAMVKYAGRDEETYLARLDRHLADIERRASAQNWPGWGYPQAAPRYRRGKSET